MRPLPLVLAIGLALAGPGAAAAQRPLERAGWLAGCWEGAVAGGFAEEHWLPLRGGTMVAAARTTRDGRTGSVELVILRERGDTLVYEAHPVGQPPHAFPLESAGDSLLVFADPAHDFPQRIVYRRVGTDSLVARIEGPRDGRTVGADYPMRRVACPE